MSDQFGAVFQIRIIPLACVKPHARLDWGVTKWTTFRQLIELCIQCLSALLFLNTNFQNAIYSIKNVCQMYVDLQFQFTDNVQYDVIIFMRQRHLASFQQPVKTNYVFKNILKWPFNFKYFTNLCKH